MRTEQPAEKEPSRTLRLVKSRILLIEQGHWLQAAEAAVADASAAFAEAAHSRSIARPDSHRDSLRRFESCVEKANAGCLRSAHALTAPGLHPASVETFGLLSAKYVTAPAQGSLAHGAALLSSAAKCKASHLSRRLVGQVVAHLSDAKAPGASG